MKEIRTVIARNIQSLRTENRLTQLELAEVLNYSDKAISKWERAEAIPDVTVLKQLADYFGVSVDFLLEEEHSANLSERRLKRLVARNHFIITLVSIIGVFALATVIFSLLIMTDSVFAPWLLFIYAVSVSSIVALVLNCIWGKRSYTLAIISVLLWSLIFSAYITLLTSFGLNWWALFLVGIPSQAILLVLSGMRAVINRKEKRNQDVTDAANATTSAEKAD